MRDPDDVPLNGASSVAQLEANVAALDNLAFEPAELAEIDRLGHRLRHQHLGPLQPGRLTAVRVPDRSRPSRSNQNHSAPAVSDPAVQTHRPGRPFGSGLVNPPPWF